MVLGGPWVSFRAIAKIDSFVLPHEVILIFHALVTEDESNTLITASIFIFVDVFYVIWINVAEKSFAYIMARSTSEYKCETNKLKRLLSHGKSYTV